MYEKKDEEPVPKNVHKHPELEQNQITIIRQPWHHIFQKTRTLTSIYIALFTIFTILAYFVHYHPILSIDVAITHEFQENKAPWLRMVMIAVSGPGSYVVPFAAFIGLVALVFWKLHLRLEALFIVGVPALSGALNLLLKLLVNRPRPTALLVTIIQEAHGQSFPSGHVMSYVAFFGLLFSFIWILREKNHWWYYTLLMITGLFVVLVGPSRIYLGDHWASDVLGGYIIGGLLLSLALWLYLTLKGRGVLATLAKPHRTSSIF